MSWVQAVMVGVVIVAVVVPALNIIVGHVTTGLPWYPRFMWKRNRLPVLQALEKAVSKGHIGAVHAVAAYKETCGMYAYKDVPEYIHVLYDAEAAYQVMGLRRKYGADAYDNWEEGR